MDTVMQIFVLLLGVMVIGVSKDGFDGVWYLTIPSMLLGVLFMGLGLGGLTGIL